MYIYTLYIILIYHSIYINNIYITYMPIHLTSTNVLIVVY